VPGLRSFVLHLLILILFRVNLTLFLRMTATRNVVLSIYVNDIVIIVSDFQLIEQLQAQLNTSFHMKDFSIFLVLRFIVVRLSHFCTSTSILKSFSS
jgi:hypothetical protein